MQDLSGDQEASWIIDWRGGARLSEREATIRVKPNGMVSRERRMQIAAENVAVEIGHPAARPET
jgi:hypothetical protein